MSRMKDGLKRLTLQEYKDMMGQFFRAFDIELGEFYNMLVQDDCCVCRVLCAAITRQSSTTPLARPVCWSIARLSEFLESSTER